ncbi:helix-turn-helix domain-containing protein [Actinomadura graeca]|uniref:Helix-turn-helix domain-containing protein n=1 Tax=Actinomadura graeca TaxID=2750812 RepID=A0ABX8QZX6_9ACTN|nr:helix-turn-helix transcriptional regulator [Actinomadura graeca]QXJ24396.1 helix-turn-helix domain-containing protein [Actinomadura graeca]
MATRSEAYDAPAIRAFANEMTAWREDAGLTKTAFADLLGYTAQWICQVEGMKSIPSEKFALDVDTYFKTNGVFQRLWLLINDTRFLAVLPPGFAEFVQQEALASTLYTFDPLVIKGLFQAPEYARAVLKSGRSESETDALVTSRMERQQILTRANPPRVVAIFDEWAVRRIVGDQQVMRSQHRHLADQARLYNVSLQIVPMAAGAYAGLPGAFTILSFDDAPDAVYTEGHVSGHLTNHRATVQEYRRRYDLIRSAAMSADDSLELLNAALEGT